MCLSHFSGRCGGIRQTGHLNNRATNNVEVGAISIGPESDHCLPLSLTFSAMLLRLDWLLKMQSKSWSWGKYWQLVGDKEHLATAWQLPCHSKTTLGTVFDFVGHFHHSGQLMVLVMMLHLIETGSWIESHHLSKTSSELATSDAVDQEIYTETHFLFIIAHDSKNK